MRGAGSQRLAVLGYHKVGEPPAEGWASWFYVPEETFAAQLSYLREEGWEVIGLQTFLEGLAEPESLPERSALITFDDGYRSMLTVTLPILLRFGHPAVLFVPTDFVGETNEFDAGYEPEEGLCDWDELRELERSGVSVQSHGASHRTFSELTGFEQAEELLLSKEALEAALEKPVEVFAYPYGDCGREPQFTRGALERAGYKAACLYGGGPNSPPAAEPYRLNRLAMGPDTDLRTELGHVR